MEYRMLGKTGIKVSALGFGTMRLPWAGDVVDEKESVRMIRRAVDEGLNYVDTAYTYLKETSETVTGRALRDGYRKKVCLATKSPVWLLNGPEDFERILEIQLRRLETEHIDFYILHSLTSKRWKDVVLKYDLISKALAAKKAGKIGHIGFSFHDHFDAFKEIVDGYDGWDFCQIQLNYLDTLFQAGKKGLEYAASKDIGVVIMEPLRGGFLAEVPPKVQEFFAPTGRTAVEWALDDLWNRPEVGVVLSGMSTMQQVEDNLLYAGRSSVGMLSKTDEKILQEAKEIFESFNSIPCTGCAYCMPCPYKVVIPLVFAVYNEYQAHGDFERGRALYYEKLAPFGNKADACVGCRSCEDACPQQIEISKRMVEVNDLFG